MIDRHRLLRGALRRAERFSPRLLQWIEQIHYDAQTDRPLGGWNWRIASPGPDPRLDAVSVYRADRMYVFGGFRNGNEVISACDVFDMSTGQWSERIPAPENVAQSHVGIALDDDGFIYIVSGQLGPQCRPAIRRGIAFDPGTGSWNQIPPLPEPRYAPATQWWNGRLHCMGGSGPDRTTPMSDHWSIAVRQGRALEEEWRVEPPMPQGACHLACVILRGDLYVFGGQQGDFIAVPNDPDYRCTGKLTEETYVNETYRLSADRKRWDRRSDMPIPASHIESGYVKLGTSVLFFGGQIYKDPHTRRLELTDAIQRYDALEDSWSIVGRLPRRVKNLVVGAFGGSVYISSGQVDSGPHDASPGRITRSTWKARLPGGIGEANEGHSPDAASRPN